MTGNVSIRVLDEHTKKALKVIGTEGVAIASHIDIRQKCTITEDGHELADDSNNVLR